MCSQKGKSEDKNLERRAKRSFHLRAHPRRPFSEFYERVTALRAQGVKVLVAIGGWNDSAGNKYSRLVNDPAARAKFNEHVIQFIQQNNFDGLDLDWEYPVCWQVREKAGLLVMLAGE